MYDRLMSDINHNKLVFQSILIYCTPTPILPIYPTPPPNTNIPTDIIMGNLVYVYIYIYISNLTIRLGRWGSVVSSQWHMMCILACYPSSLGDTFDVQHPIPICTQCGESRNHLICVKRIDFLFEPTSQLVIFSKSGHLCYWKMVEVCTKSWQWKYICHIVIGIGADLLARMFRTDII